MFKCKRIWVSSLMCSVILIIYFIFIVETILKPLLAMQYIADRRSSSNEILMRYYEDDTGNTLEELSSNMVRINNSVFFIESTCHQKGIHLEPRQACSVESAALQNPDLDIYILFPSPVGHGWKSNIYIKEILSYKNVKLRHINMSTFFEDTPLHKKWKQNRAGLRTSVFLHTHTSDILRYTLLWKYGGYYIDLDVILFRPFDKMMNFAGSESVTAVSSSLLSMTKGGLVADMCINELVANFKGSVWGYNGPGVITRVMKILCQKDKIEEMHGATCEGFSILKPHSLYPVRWQEWYLYFSSENSTGVMAKVNGSLGVHVWNRYSKDTPVIKGSDQPYSLLARNFCPKVYSIIPDNSF